MNRAERRRKARENTSKDATITVTRGQLNKMIEEKMEDYEKIAFERAFKFAMAIPVMILHDNFKDVMRKSIDGVCREKRFFDMSMELAETIADGYAKLPELWDVLEEECGCKMVIWEDGDE